MFSCLVISNASSLYVKILNVTVSFQDYLILMTGCMMSYEYITVVYVPRPFRIYAHPSSIHTLCLHVPLRPWGRKVHRNLLTFKPSTRP